MASCQQDSLASIKLRSGFRWKTGAKAAAVYRAVPDQNWSITRQQAGMRERYMRKVDPTRPLFERFDGAVTELASYCRIKPDTEDNGASLKSDTPMVLLHAHVGHCDFMSDC